VDELERKTVEIGKSLAAVEPHVPIPRRLEERAIDSLLSDPGFKTQVFRLVDVYPALRSTSDRFSHLDSYLSVPAAPGLVRRGLRLASSSSLGRKSAVRVLDFSIARMARRFIAGTTPAEAIPVLKELWADGTAPILDLLGEVTVTDPDADRYSRRVEQYLTDVAIEMAGWDDQAGLRRDHHGDLPRLSVALKPTAMSAHYHPLTAVGGIDEAAGRIRPILQAAQQHSAFVWFDMEHFAVRDLTETLFRRLATEFPDVEMGIVVQAYLRDSVDQLARLIEFAKSRTRPIGIRLVKGAYWDTETIEAQAHGWPCPVFEVKSETDANFEAATGLLNGAAEWVRPAYASHNLRSVARAIADARHRGLGDDVIEVQVLYGMGDDLRAAASELGIRTRFYAPVGELIPGMAYLVRRLLENTSNESFLRQSRDKHELDELLRAPA
jgi:RHH-type proline utilization regulon transcriptional repressor/proline dehydrogenase/delta 1-pyrroline-5-carboxylate dehydrogenase